jgi:acyl-CoA synthetase (AMP-forming)/AMP-acid ligase II
VFGVPDERAGELPVAAVQLDPAVSLADGALEGLVAESLARYKRLHDVVMVGTIPRLPSGKVLRRVLRDEWMAAHAGSELGA